MPAPHVTPRRPGDQEPARAAQQRAEHRWIVAPGLLDRYLARTGYNSQQTGRPTGHDRPNNLWHPLDGPGGHDYGARGEFTGRSHSHSPQAWLSRHRLLAAAGLGATAAGLAAWLPQ
ncbi:hypothetical protein B0E53_03988 [Micromonospora sp. MH33]|nr:hypothetical protein B0E53_03988 [Micromonospora sp. MH33]